MSTKIQVEHLTKRFGRVTAVDDVSFEVGAGTVTGFLGPNGAGKTTTLRMLLGLVAPTSGTAMIGGHRYRDLRDPVRHVGALLESSSFHPARPAVEHLRVVATAAGLPLGRAEEVLDQVGLADAAGRPVGGFSLGMRQRLGLATALLGDPAVLVLDEPANGLDPEGVRWLRSLLRSLAGEGRTVLLSSHLLAEAAQTVDEVVVISGGRLVVHSPVADLIGSGRPRVRIRTPQATLLRDRLAARGIAAELAGLDSVAAATDAETVGAVVAEGGVAVHELTTDRSLEDAFFALVQEGGQR
jgi:ABC-2 type transport system ATP-binding protein